MGKNDRCNVCTNFSTRSNLYRAAMLGFNEAVGVLVDVGLFRILKFSIWPTFLNKNVDLGDSQISNLATEKKFFQGEDSIICEGLSFDICSYVVGLLADIGFGGLVQKKLVLFGCLVNFARIMMKCVAHISDQFYFTYGSHVRLCDAARVLVDVHLFRFVKKIQFDLLYGQKCWKN